MKVFGQALLLIALFVASLVVARVLTRWWISRNAPATVVEAPHVDLLAQMKAPRVLFTSSTCPYCAEARKWLDARGVFYIEQVIDRSPSARRIFEALEEDRVPVLVLADRRVRGFSEPDYERLFPASTHRVDPWLQRDSGGAR